jgi:hypothetical protein
MRWTRLISLTMLIYLVWGGVLTPRVSLAQSSLEPVVLETHEQGFSLAWRPPAYELAVIEVEGQPYSQIQMPGTTPSGQPGYPELPVYSSLVGLPTAGGAQLRLVEVERRVVQLPHPPLPAPVPQPVHPALLDPQSPLMGGPTVRQPDPAIYTEDAFYPEAIAELGPVEQVRHWRVARLIINPLRVDPVTGEMEVIDYVRLEVEFDQPASAAVIGFSEQGPSAPIDPAMAFARTLAATLLNPRASQWSAPPAPSLGAEEISPFSGDNLVKVTVAQAGLYALTYNELAGAGLPVGTLDPRTLQLSHGWPRQEVAILVEGEADGVFNPGDRLLFYAEPEFSRFVDEDVYFLSHGQANGLRMSNQSANPAALPAGTAWRTAVAETNQLYDSHYPGRDGDYWYWDMLRQPVETSGTYSVQLEAPLTTGPAATLTLWLQGYTDPGQNPDHRVAVSVNGNPVGEQTWNGAQAIEANFTVSAANLQAGTNQVRLSLPGLSGVTVEGTWFDAMRLTYPISQGGATQLIFQGEAGQKAYTLAGWPSANLKVYDITDPAQPRRLTDYNLTLNGSTYALSLGDAGPTPARYLVVPNNQIASPLSLTPAAVVNDPPGGADYVIITHPNFASAISPLAAHRAAQGLRVVTVDVQAIYDAYGPGRMAPEAVKTFLEHAFTTWNPPAPTYVLLVGDGSYDFKNYSGYNPQTFIPPYLAHIDPWWGETAADNQFVTLNGGDRLPEMLIGRLAVNTSAKVATVVDKIIRYETTPVPGDWNARQLFVADDPDYAGDFYADSDQGYSQVKEPFVGQRFYYSSGAGSEPYLYGDVETLRTLFLNNFNQGASIVTFHGHSSWLQWAVEGIFRYYPPPYTGPDDLTSMSNQYRLPVVLEMTCFTGSFHRPEVATVDESLLNLSGGGAVAVWGSTGLGISTGHVSLQTGFHEAINDQGERNLGAAILAGKMKLNATGFHQDLLDTFTLFGDPALTLNFTITPFSNGVYLPIILR